jgi:predicted membrane metal-binding protein
VGGGGKYSLKVESLENVAFSYFLVLLPEVVAILSQVLAFSLGPVSSENILELFLAVVLFR